MRQTHSFVIFISIVLLLCFLLNFYVLSRLCGFFKVKRTAVFWSVLFACTVALIGATTLQSFSGSMVSRVIYVLVSGWYGILCLFFSVLLVYEVLRLFVKINPHTAGISVLAIVAVAAIYSIVNAQLVRTKTLTIHGNVNYDIVQLSDIHLGSVSNGFFERVIKKVNGLDPDAVLITGDLVDNHNERTKAAIGLLKDLDAPAFFVIGNHERHAGVDSVTESLEAAGVTVLRNRAADYGQIHIIGIDDNNGERYLEPIIEEIEVDESRFSILMCHRPVGLEAASDAGVDLFLAGHTHSGQIFPFNYIVQLFFRNFYGLYQYENTYLYVTSGTGTWGPRMRLGSRSEIVLLKIRKNGSVGI